MRWLPASLAGRVALATALVGALSAVIAALVSWQLATAIIDEAEIHRLRSSAEIFHNDLDLKDPSSSLDHEIAVELEELAPASIRIAVYEHGRHIAGDALPIPPDGCAAVRHDDVVQRSCATTRGTRTVVAATTRATGASPTFLLGTALASLGAALVAAAVGRRGARWAMAPLEKLTQALDGVRAEAPAADALPPPGDVREVSVLHEALSALVLRLGEALSRARRFSGDAAHELRTPLTVLSGQLELLLEETPPGERRAELLALQLRVRTLIQLVERLLVLATSEQGPLLAAEPVAIEDVAQQCVEALPAKERARVALEIDGQAVTNGDEQLLRALVDNGLDNALKFSGEGPVTLRVRETSSEVTLDIVDAGPGLDDSARTRAFDPFFRSPSARAGRLPGHGIGLALVAQVTQLHAGSCSFLPTTRGAHLRVVLPAWRPKLGSEPVPAMPWKVG